MINPGQNQAPKDPASYQLIAVAESEESMVHLRRKGALPPPPPHIICEALSDSEVRIKWLAGDGSDRCYYRLIPSKSDKSLVLMQLSGQDAISLQEGGYEWIEMAEILSNQGFYIPKVIAALPDYAALIIEDYGDKMLEQVAWDNQSSTLNREVLKPYDIAIRIIRKFLTIPQNPEQTWCQRSFDEERLTWELNFFYQKYLHPIAGVNFTPEEKLTFAKEIKDLSQFLASYAKYFVHRDYHSRNLMVQPNHDLAVIDFQDARLGAPAYDLVSLVFDSYVPFNNKQRLEIFQTAVSKIRDKLGRGLEDEILATWKPTLLQRQLKAIGSFGYLTLDKNRGDYLKYVGPALLTLLENSVEDERWPFVSGTIPKLIKTHLSGLPNDGV